MKLWTIPEFQHSGLYQYFYILGLSRIIKFGQIPEFYIMDHFRNSIFWTVPVFFFHFWTITEVFNSGPFKNLQMSQGKGVRGVWVLLKLGQVTLEWGVGGPKSLCRAEHPQPVRNGACRTRSQPQGIPHGPRSDSTSIKQS